MKIVNMTPHSLVIEYGDHQVDLWGDVILRPPGYVAYISSLDHWLKPFDNEPIPEDVKLEIKEFAFAELKKTGIALIWDDTRLDPNWMERLQDKLSQPIEVSSQSKSVQFSIKLDGHHMLVDIDVVDVLSPISPGLDGKKYTVHLKRNWDDGSPVSPEQIAALTVPPHRFTPSSNPSSVEIVYEK